jgi:hypothetical protein
MSAYLSIATLNVNGVILQLQYMDWVKHMTQLFVGSMKFSSLAQVYKNWK